MALEKMLPALPCLESGKGILNLSSGSKLYRPTNFPLQPFDSGIAEVTKKKSFQSWKFIPIEYSVRYTQPKSLSPKRPPPTWTVATQTGNFSSHAATQTRESSTRDSYSLSLLRSPLQIPQLPSTPGKGLERLLAKAESRR